MIILNEEINGVLLENSIPKDNIITKYTNDNNVKKLIDTSKKYFTTGKYDKTEVEDLFQDPKVQSYLQAAVKVGRRDGWIRGGLLGSASGATVGAISGLLSGSIVLFFALVLLGAVAGGLAFGYLTSRAFGILSKWEAERKISKSDGMRVHV